MNSTGMYPIDANTKPTASTPIAVHLKALFYWSFFQDKLTPKTKAAANATGAFFFANFGSNQYTTVLVVRYDENWDRFFLFSQH